MVRGTFLAAVCSVLVAGCTTAAPTPSALVRQAAIDGPCLPPGSPAGFLDWPLEATNVLRLGTQDGSYRLAIVEQYRSRDGRAMRVLWVEGHLVLVDPQPDDPDAMPWIDRGLIADDDASLRRPRGAPCQWRPVGERTAQVPERPLQSTAAMVVPRTR